MLFPSLDNIEFQGLGTNAWDILWILKISG